MKSIAAISIAVFIFSVAETSALAADPGASAIAESLFDQGRTLLDSGHTEEACAKFEASRSLEPAPGTTLNLADCYARLGRTATAWVTFVDAAADARREHDDFREREASTRAGALAPKLSRLRLHFAARPPSARVEIDGASIPNDVTDSWLPVDPGSRRIHVSAPGFAPRDVTVTIPNGPSETTAEIDPLLASTVTSSFPPRADHADDAKLVPGVPFWSGLRVASVITAGASIACAGVGLGFGAAASSKWSDAQKICPGSSCTDPNARSLQQSAGTFADVSTGLLIGAGVLLAGATVFWIFAPKATPTHVLTAASANGFSAQF
ncbi:MAG: hypothetical protein ABI183_07425 [Polyangiaceae bacterium]